MDQAATNHVLTIVQMLAKGATHKRLSPIQIDIFNKNVEELTNYDSDEFVCMLLAMVRDATGVLTPNVATKLSQYL
jgi:hypothetical protein